MPTGGESIGVELRRSSCRAASGRRSARAADPRPACTAVSAMISCSWLRGDFGLRRHEVERRRLTDVDLGLVHARQLLRELQRRLPRVDVGAAPTPGSSTALFTFAVVCTTLSRSRVSAMSRLIAARRRAAAAARRSMKIAEQRLRHVQRQPRLQQRVVAVQEAVAVGVRSSSTPTLYDVPNHGSRWVKPAFDVTTSVRVGVGIRKLAGGCSWLLRCTLVLNVGLNAPAAAATRVSLICGIEPVGRRDRGCSRAPS